MKEVLVLQISLKNELMTTVRLATGGVCSLAGFSLDGSEDCKVCVTESLLLLSHRGYSSARVAFTREDGLKIAVEGGERTECAHPDGEDEISFALLSALAKDVITEKRDGVLSGISFRFRAEA